MQLTGGQYKGRKIFTPQNVRPTLAIAREGVFSSLYSQLGDFEGKSFLDMFLGSGIMTLEALSRGFLTTSFEIDFNAIKIARQNAKGFKNLPKILKADVFSALKSSNEKFDVIYADPPWTFSYEKVFDTISNHLVDDGIAIVEYDKRKKSEVLLELEKFSALELFKEKKYGRCCLLFLKLA